MRAVVVRRRIRAAHARARGRGVRGETGTETRAPAGAAGVRVARLGDDPAVQERVRLLHARVEDGDGPAAARVPGAPHGGDVDQRDALGERDRNRLVLGDRRDVGGGRELLKRGLIDVGGEVRQRLEPADAEHRQPAELREDAVLRARDAGALRARRRPREMSFRHESVPRAHADDDANAPLRLRFREQARPNPRRLLRAHRWLHRHERRHQDRRAQRGDQTDHEGLRKGTELGEGSLLMITRSARLRMR